MTVCLKQLTRKFQMPDGGAVYFEEKVAQAARPGWSAGNDACGHSCAGGGEGGRGGVTETSMLILLVRHPN